MSRTRISIILTAATFALATGAPVALASDRATTKEAENMIHQAVSYLKKEGRDKALAAFSDPAGPFAYRDLYVTAYDYDGKCLAHGANPSRVGKYFIEDKDADGKLFLRERLAFIKEKGRGWQDYKYLNPATKKVEQKVVYCEGTEGVILCCGAYKP